MRANGGKDYKDPPDSHTCSASSDRCYDYFIYCFVAMICGLFLYILFHYYCCFYCFVTMIAAPPAQTKKVSCVQAAAGKAEPRTCSLHRGFPSIRPLLSHTKAPCKLPEQDRKAHKTGRTATETGSSTLNPTPYTLNPTP